MACSSIKDKTALTLANSPRLRQHRFQSPERSHRVIGRINHANPGGKKSWDFFFGFGHFYLPKSGKNLLNSKKTPSSAAQHSFCISKSSPRGYVSSERSRRATIRHSQIPRVAAKRPNSTKLVECWDLLRFQERYNTPLEHTLGNPLSQLWKESLYSLLVKV